MSSERDGQLVRFECDDCGELLEISSTSFLDAWEVAKKDHGWRVFKNEDDAWEHRCDKCRRR